MLRSSNENIFFEPDVFIFFLSRSSNFNAEEIVNLMSKRTQHNKNKTRWDNTQKYTQHTKISEKKKKKKILKTRIVCYVKIKKAPKDCK